MSPKGRIILALIIIIVVVVIVSWSKLIHMMLPADSRPYEIQFEKASYTSAELARVGERLTQTYGLEFAHAARFKEAGISSYDGPATCLGCHEEITYTDSRTGEEITTDLMRNLTTSAHYLFFSKSHPNVYGFNGELADNFPMGKINRPCPKPGSFAMTAWAEIVVNQNGDTLSEGCGQCHVGGQYQAPLGEMMPLYQTTQVEMDAIDCLICHAVAYDMNKKQVVVDDNGLKRWEQDRSISAAMSVTTPTAQACLRCHQHNFGGDIYVDEADSSYMQSLVNTGANRPRVLHPGSKRGTPYSPTWDVHARAGMSCIECHTTHGHYIAKGTHTTTMMANDLPDIEVQCENCHTAEPHAEDAERAEYLNQHVQKIACQTCHIPNLHEDNATMRDFDNTEWEEHPGIYIYHDSVKESMPGTGIIYRWWNGDCTFLGNPIGDNPNGNNLYKFYKANRVWPEFTDFDYDSWYEDVMRPIAKNGRPSKLYAMKHFNGKQHIDLANMGPFGGMFVPYNLPAYYHSGDADKAASAEMDKSMMEMMYGFMFKYYILDKFMSFMDIDGWNTESFEDVKQLKNVEARWIPQDASLEISHAIRREGALSCANCHSQSSVLNFTELGYTEEEIEALTVNPLE